MFLADKFGKMRQATAASVRAFFCEQRQDVEVSQIEMACSASTKNLGAGIIGVVLTCLGIWQIPVRGYERAMLPYLAAWALLLIFALLRGMVIARAYRRLPPDNARLIRQGRRLANNGVVAGCLWGASSFLILNSADIYQATFLTCAIGLVIMGGAGAQAQYGRLVNGFVISTSATFVLGLFAHPILHPLIAIGFMLYAAVALGFAHQQQESVKKILELNVENDRLLHQARESMVELDKARAVAENASRAKTRFLAATSHDLRQPVHALSLYVSHLRQCCDLRELSDTIDKAEAAMSAMKDLLDAVLDLSRISLGTVKPDMQSVLLNEILQRMRVQLLPQAALKGLALVIDRCETRVRTDPVLLERILRNIILNAIRYTDAGTIMVRVRVRAGAGRAIVRVIDTGIGIPRGERERVFEEFYQVGNQERDRHKGLGLGLAIVAQLGVLLGHPVSLRSRVGRGTIFRIVLDAAAEACEARARLQVCGGSDFVSGCAVLVVDDDALVLDSMRLTLQDMGCQVIAADSIFDALGKLGGEARVPDLIISDYRLRGGESGVDAIRALRQNIQGDEDALIPLPGLILTGDTSPDEMQAVLSHDLAMLHKPVAPILLHATMNAMLAAYSARLRTSGQRKA